MGPLRTINRNFILSIILLTGISVSFVRFVIATTPDPGHDFTAVSGGVLQGYLLYGSATDTLSGLPKDTNATRYLSNQGTSNNPSWNQINLANGVTGSLPVGNVAAFTGLGDCDNVTTSKLLWDISSGVFSCGTDQAGAASGWTDDGTSVRLTTITDLVGIGDSTPTTTLDVTGNASISDNFEVGNGLFSVQADGNVGIRSNIFVPDARLTVHRITANATVATFIAGSGIVDPTLVMRGVNVGPFVLEVTKNTGSPDLSLNPTAGGVGIGTLSPDQKLDVAGNIVASTSGNVDLILNATNATSGTEGKFTMRSATTSERLDFLNGASSVLMTLASSGNVGINTTIPSGTLDVIARSGSIPALIVRGIGFGSQTGNLVEIRYTDGSMRDVISATGQLGIFAQGPEEKIEVGGNILASASGQVNITLNNIFTSQTEGLFRIRTGGDNSQAGIHETLDISGGSGAILFTISSKGYAGFNTNAPAAGGVDITSVNGTLPSLIVRYPGFGNQTADIMQIKDTGGGTKYVINSAGSISVGSTTPDQKLDVTGNILASTSGNVDLILKSTSAVGDEGKFTIRSTGASDRLEIMGGATPTSFMTISSIGNVGIGDTTPTTKLDIAGTASVSSHFEVGGLLTLSDASRPTLRFSLGSTPLWDFGKDNSGNNDFWIGDTTNVRFEIERSTGDVGLGTTDPDAQLHIYDTTRPAILIDDGSTAKSRVGKVVTGGRMDVASNLWYNGSSWNLDDTTQGGAMITMLSDGGFGYWNTPAKANPISITNAATRMYITPIGRISMGASNLPATFVHIASTGGDQNILRLQDSNGTCDHNPGAGSEVVTCSSDIKLKTDIVDFNGALQYLSSFRIRDYDVKAGGTGIGVVAQEVQLVHPELVHPVGPTTLGVEQPDPWILVRAIQELDIQNKALAARLNSLEARLAALDGKQASSAPVSSASVSPTTTVSSSPTRSPVESSRGITPTPSSTISPSVSLPVITPSSISLASPLPVTAVDITPPVITLTGDAVVNLDIGDAYTEAGATASDGVDGPVTAVFSGLVDTTATGSYTIRYNASDAAGNEAIEVTRTVQVGAPALGFPDTGFISTVKRNPQYILIPMGTFVVVLTVLFALHGKKRRSKSERS